MAKKDLFEQICALDPEGHMGVDMTNTVAVMEKALGKWNKMHPQVEEDVKVEEPKAEVEAEEPVKEKSKSNVKLPIGRRKQRRYIRMHPLIKG
jgi:hypothetical protein